MPWSRTLLALLLSLTMAFAPVAGIAMAKSCVMSSGLTMADPADCPCEKSMPDCGTMPQCQTVAGCSSQCLTTSAVVPAAARPAMVDRIALALRDGLDLTSLSIKPPAPPPRA